MEIVTFGDRKNKAVVFLHGWGGGFSSFIYFAKRLGDNFFCVLCDMNSSLEQNRVLGVGDFAQELKVKLDELELKSVCLIGHSFGGRVSAKFCDLFPEKVEKIILVDSAGLPPRRGICYHLKVKRFKFYKFLAKHGLVSEKKLEKFGSSDYKNLSPNKKATFVKIVNEDLTESFKKIQCPTLIYWGEDDKDTPLYMAKKLNKIIKDSGLIVIKGAGHFSYIDNHNNFLLVATSFLQS